MTVPTTGITATSKLRIQKKFNDGATVLFDGYMIAEAA